MIEKLEKQKEIRHTDEGGYVAEVEPKTEVVRAKINEIIDVINSMNKDT